jgi:hypothetical protein
MNIGVSSTYMKKNSVFVKVLIDILEYVREDKNFSHKKDIVVLSLHNKQKDLMTCYNREKDYLKGFQLFLSFLKTTNKKSQFVKLYLYSIFKSIA